MVEDNSTLFVRTVQSQERQVTPYYREDQKIIHSNFSSHKKHAKWKAAANMSLPDTTQHRNGT